MPRRLTTRSLALLWLGLCAVPSCSPAAPSSVNPKAALSRNTTAQQEFRALSAAWHSQGSRERILLEPRLRAFVERYPTEDPTRLVRAYLAWILYQKGELVTAERWIDPNLRGPEGRAKDFSHVVEAALMTEHGRPFEALKLLRPLQGKIIDPVERFLATEQLVKSALAANLYAEALGYMVDWIDQAPERERAAILSSIEARIARIPENYLERSLEALEPDDTSTGSESDARKARHKHWLFQTLTRHLAGVALRTKDVELAARIIEKNPSLALDPNAGKLVQLATGGEPPATIAGHTIGLLLETEAPLARRRSTSVSTGISFALEQTAGKNARVELVFEQASGDVNLALSKLSAEGAALIVAGVDALSSEGAARYAQVTRTPVLLLERTQNNNPFTFALGVDPADQDSLLTTFMVNIGDRTLAYGPLDHDCKAKAEESPVAGWQQAQVSGVALLTAEACAASLMRQAQSLKFVPRWGLGLEAAHVSGWRSLAKETLWVKAGHFPYLKTEPDDLNAFRARTGREPNWYETLGRDAAQIAIEVLEVLPELRSTDAAAVEDFHELVRTRLQSFSSQKLWSTAQGRFDKNGNLTRELTLTSKAFEP